MAQIEYTGASLVVHVVGLDKLWALKSQLEIPIEHVIGAERATEEAQTWWKGWRLPGTDIPGVITAGTFYKHGEKVFWDVHHPEQAIAILLRHELYNRLIVEVDDPDVSIATVNGIVARARE
jgi:hypothetical protein